VAPVFAEVLFAVGAGPGAAGVYGDIRGILQRVPTPVACLVDDLGDHVLGVGRRCQREHRDGEHHGHRKDAGAGSG